MAFRKRIYDTVEALQADSRAGEVEDAERETPRRSPGGGDIQLNGLNVSAPLRCRSPAIPAPPAIDLDAFIEAYTTDRTNAAGAMGKTPMPTFIDSLTLAMEKTNR